MAYDGNKITIYPDAETGTSSMLTSFLRSIRLM